MTTELRAYVAALLLSAAAAGQSISEPVAGVVFDPSQNALRLLLGIPASSNLSDALRVESELQAVAAAPNYLIANSADSVYAVSYEREKVTMRRLGSFRAEQAAPGPGAVSAVVVSGSLLRVFTGLPERPILASEIDAGHTPSMVAVSDSGDAVLASFSDGRLLAFLGGEVINVPGYENVSALNFLHGSRDAVVASGDRLWLLRGTTGTEGQVPLGRVNEPFALALTPDNRRLFVLSRSSRDIAVFDLENTRQEWVSAPVDPRFLHPIQAGVFRLTDGTDEVIWLLDARGDRAAFHFVPARATR